MNSFRFAIAAPIVLGLSLVGTCRADDKVPDEKTGLKVGAKAPSFTLKDQNGKERSLDQFLKNGKVALVFYRSAGW
ncbi:MAG TPA: hypothetical protein VGP68_01210 [Gemmataceae bacterium]|jgi:cytochrome oxidase Cu insertion factor (SCO1/SenC/PrrC family)|nr:hypothetical protein [Gemmataceae bacterium]